MLGMLREVDEAGTRPPTQGLDDLPDLVDDVLVAGVSVELVRSGAVSAVDSAVSLAAYRIAQESLTNVIKHSAAATARVVVAVAGDRLDLEVSDPGPARAGARVGSAGHGLVGLDERARLVGGSLTYGARGDGFHVRASLPTSLGTGPRTEEGR
jgi:signal transduction histidine kinase